VLKPKRPGTDLGFKVFVGKDGTRYLVFRTGKGAFHTFAEVEAMEAAKDCGAGALGNTRAMWESLWSKQ
jgi:hypothetical protein